MAAQEPVIQPHSPQNHSQEPKTASTTSQHQQPPTAPLILPSNYSNRVVLKTILERSDGGVGLKGEKVVIGGWVVSFEEVKKHVPPSQTEDNNAASPGHKDCCLEILQTRVPLFQSVARILCTGGNAKMESARQAETPNPPPPPPPSMVNLLVSDGSCVASIQVIVEFSEAFPYQPLHIGTCILAEGMLNITSEEKQNVELKAEKILHIGRVEDDKYPLSGTRVPFETLRSCPHVRPRRTTVASVMRTRNALAFATHAFFREHGFLSVQVPIITITTDGSGFSKKFQVTTLCTEGVSLEDHKPAIEEMNDLLQQFKRSESNREASPTLEQDLLKTNQLASHLEAEENLKSSKADKANIPEHFFCQPTYLNVSGHLHLESYACALGNVYSFGPRFQADKMISAKHAPEMWMVEAEMAFSELEDAMNCAEDYFRFLCKWVLESCQEDIKLVTKRIDKCRAELVQAMLSCSYPRITYIEALEVLKQATDKTIETKPEQKTALTAKQLSYLADGFYKSPVLVYNFPKEVKPFYARLNEDGKTVAAFDMVIPNVGTIIAGSQNEERIDKLNERINELGLPKEQYEWYLDLRRHGTVKHSGFSVEFDLVVLFSTGVHDIRDVIPFPRSRGKLNN